MYCCKEWDLPTLCCLLGINYIKEVVKMSKAEEAVEKIAENLAAELSCEIADVEFVKEGSEWFLRVFVDREGGVDLDFCEVFSRRRSYR